MICADMMICCVNRTARLLSVAHGGQIFISAAVHELFKQAPQSDIAPEDLGYRVLDTMNIGDANQDTQDFVDRELHNVVSASIHFDQHDAFLYEKCGVPMPHLAELRRQQAADQLRLQLQSEAFRCHFERGTTMDVSSALAEARARLSDTKGRRTGGQAS